MRIALSSVAGGVFVLLAATLGGCGSSSSPNGLAAETPGHVVAAARSAADGAATVHVAGTLTGAGAPISIDLELVRGKGGRGRIALGALSIELVRIESAVYVRGNAAFYRRVAGPRAARLLEGKWLKGFEGGALSDLASLTDLDTLIDTALREHGTLAIGAAKTLDGQKVLSVNDASRGGTVYVAATGAPYPIELLRAGGSGGRLLFDRWNQPISLEAPADALSVKQLDRRPLQAR